MAEPSSGKDEPEMTKSNSFTKFMNENSPKKKLSNPLTKLLRRKSSKRGEDKSEEASSRPSDVDSETIEEEEDEKDESLEEEVKEVVETVSRDLFHHEKKDTPIDPTTDAAIDKSSSSSSSSSEEDTKERKHDFLGKIKVGFGKAKEGLKEEYDKAKEELKSALLHKEKTLAEQHHQPLDMIKMPEISAETPIDEVKAPNLVQRIQEEVVAIVGTIEDKTKGKTPVPQEKTPDPQEKTPDTQEESNEIKEEKKEDNCVSSLAKGLQSFCSWGSKKED